MRGLRRNPWLFGLGGLLAILVVYGGHARADVTTDQAGSIVIFPKVIADGTRDTLIQVTNRSNVSAQAHCFYIASGTCSATQSVYCNADSECPSGESCVLPCNPTNFDIFLTAQQSTQWRVSTGRFEPSPLQATPPCKIGQTCTCTVDAASGGLKCPGFDPGTAGFNNFAVKPTGTRFRGELKCVQIMSSDGLPIDSNSLMGEAVIEHLGSGQVSEYNAISILALAGQNNRDTTLRLLSPGTTVGTNEYNSCPTSIVLNHYAEGATDDFTGATVSTELTVVPCTELPELAITPAIVGFVVFNELEQRYSADGVNFDCMYTRRLGDIPVANANLFTRGNLGTDFAKMRITPSSSSICLTGSNRGGVCTSDSQCPGALPPQPDGSSLGCRPATGVVAVAEEFHTLSDRTAAGTAAVNGYVEGNRGAPGDIIVLPPEF